MKLKEGEEKLKKKERDFEEVIAAFQNPFFYNIWESSALFVQKQLATEKQMMEMEVHQLEEKVGKLPKHSILSLKQGWLTSKQSSAVSTIDKHDSQAPPSPPAPSNLHGCASYIFYSDILTFPFSFAVCRVDHISGTLTIFLVC